MQAVKINCKNCGYEWFPRTEQPYKCPRCQSPLNPKKKASVTADQATTTSPDKSNLKGGKVNKE